MKKVNNKGKTKKELSIAVLLILILIFSVIFILFGICIGFLINSFINYSFDNIITNTIFTLSVGIVYMTLLLILIRNKDSEKNKPFKWYLNCILLSLTMTLIITAVTVFISGPDDDSIINYLVGFTIFPLIGIITTPNIVKYVKNDTTKWKKVFYKNGNLHTLKNSKDYYMVNTPVSYEKEILSAVCREQIKNILVVVGFMLMVAAIFIYRISTGHHYTGNIVMNLMEVRFERRFGLIFFLFIFFLAFCIPIISFYVANALKKIRVVKNQEYIAYHVILPTVNNGRIGIYEKNKHYNYKYCTCVGIKEKDVHFTPGVLIFIPDDVLFYPDKNN